nr:uncharacterized protein LOC127295898 [Lolium perenne]
MLLLHMFSWVLHWLCMCCRGVEARRGEICLGKLPVDNVLHGRTGIISPTQLCFSRKYTRVHQAKGHRVNEEKLEVLFLMQKLGGVSFHWERGWLLIHPMVMLILEALEYIPEQMFLMGYLLYRLPVCRFSEQSSHRSPGFLLRKNYLRWCEFYEAMKTGPKARELYHWCRVLSWSGLTPNTHQEVLVG